MTTFDQFRVSTIEDEITRYVVGYLRWDREISTKVQFDPETRTVLWAQVRCDQSLVTIPLGVGIGLAPRVIAGAVINSTQLELWLQGRLLAKVLRPRDTPITAPVPPPDRVEEPKPVRFRRLMRAD